MIMDDNNIICNDNKPLMERFTHPMEYDKHGTYSFPENNHVKSIVKGRVDNLLFNSTPHVPNTNLMCCDAIGNSCDSSPFKKYDFRGAYLKHFFGKTIEEWVTYKMRRGASDRAYESSKKTYNIEKFFTINEKTEEKLKFVKDYISKINSKNLSIFICTHKDFEQVVFSSRYKVVDNRYLKDKEINGLTDKFYSEILTYYNVAKYEYLSKYVGFCHYRRYFNFLDNIPNIDETLKQYDAIVAKPLSFKDSVYEQYKRCHNIEDVEIVRNIIHEKFNDYEKAFDVFFKGKLMLPYNMFIMRREDFLEYIEFVKNVLDEYLKVVGTDIEKRIEENKDKYLKSFSPNNTVEYQYRIGGYLAERLTNVFIIKKFKRLKPYSVIITENKYSLKEKNT